MYTCSPALKTLMKDIYDDSHKAEPDLDILSESENDILTYDYIQNREVNYHTVEPDAAWLEAMMYFTPAVTKSREMMTPLGQPSIISSILLRLDPNLFTCLRHIIFTTESEDDIDAIASHLNVEPCEVCDFADYIGMFWYYQNAVVVNMTAILNSIRQMKTKIHLTDTEAAEETVIGIYSTLVHELRHLALENPYLESNAYPDSEKSEEAVEDYCRNVCDNMLGMLKQTARKCYNIIHIIP